MKTKIIFFYSILMLFFLMPLFGVNAATGTCTRTGNNGISETAGSCDTTSPNCPEGYVCKTTSSSDNTVSLTNPLGTNKTDIPTLLGNIINSVLGVIGSLALVMFIYGGATWMLSVGNAERVTKGKQIIIWAAVGIIIIFTAYALVKFVLTTVTGTGG